jgi:hypothetical protein
VRRHPPRRRCAGLPRALAVRAFRSCTYGSPQRRAGLPRRRDSVPANGFRPCRISMESLLPTIVIQKWSPVPAAAAER